MAFIAHAAIAPIGYTMAQEIAKKHADAAVDEALGAVTPRVESVQKSQDVFQTWTKNEVGHIKEDLEDLVEQNRRIEGKIDRLIERELSQ